MGETVLGPKNCLRIFKLIKSVVNGKDPFRQYTPAQKHLSHGLIQLSHREGGWEKLDVPADPSRLKLNGKKPAPLLANH